MTGHSMNFMDYIVAAPEIVLLGLICAVLIADLFIDDENRVRTFWISILSLGAMLLVLNATAPAARAVIFSGSYVSDPLSHILKIAAVILVAITFLYSRDYLRANEIHKGEFYLLGLIGLLGMMIMMSANSMLTMYLGLETLALSMYALVAIDRNNVTSAESAMKYFILGAIASGCLLYGISWVYGVTGSLQFHEIAAAISSDPSLNNLPLWFGLAFLIVGIAFKFGAVPFHMWLPDVYQGARTPVTLYLASAPKLAALALFLRILVDGLGGLHDTWAAMIMIIAVLSLLVGNFVAIAQTNIKRMLGYSTIAHVGFILLALFCGTEQGNGGPGVVVFDLGKGQGTRWISVRIGIRRIGSQDRTEHVHVGLGGTEDGLVLQVEEVGDGDSRQDTDDRHNDHQLDQGETFFAFSHFHQHFLSSIFNGLLA